MPTRLGALGDDDVDAVLLVLQRVTGTARERGHRDVTFVRGPYDFRRRRAERVDQQRHRVLERDVHLREARRVGPAEQVVRFASPGSGAMPRSLAILHEVVRLRDHA